MDGTKEVTMFSATVLPEQGITCHLLIRTPTTFVHIRKFLERALCFVVGGDDVLSLHSPRLPGLPDLP